MRKIKLGGREIKMIGSPITPLFYKREFNQSLSGDLMVLQTIEQNPAIFDDINLLQMIWAMEKTTNMGKLEDFESWLLEFENMDLMAVAEDVINEAMNATFCESKDHKEKTKPKGKQKAK